MNAFITAAAAAALLSASTVPALAQSIDQAPVAITSCALSATPRLFEPGVQPDGSGLQIGFVNHAQTPATNVRFLVRIGRSEQIFDDTGSFASGTPIAQVFSPASTSYAAIDASCQVQSVTFADGTTWQR